MVQPPVVASFNDGQAKDDRAADITAQPTDVGAGVSEPRRSLGILICGHIPEGLKSGHGNYGRMFEQLLGVDAFDYRYYAVVDGVYPTDPADADSWLITGSRHGAYEDHAWIPPLENFIRRTYSAAVPMVGICFGHQIIAQALGGKVVKHDAGWSVGLVTYKLDERFGITQAPLLAYHQDQVLELPADATPVGSSSFCRYAALAYGDRALTLQPHPEFEDPFMRGLLETRGMALPGNLQRDALDGLGQPLATTHIGAALRDFLYGQARTSTNPAPTRP